MLKKILIIFLSLLLLELSLRCGGHLYTLHHANEIKKRLLASEKNDVRIICLGDSNTFGSESSYGNSYPEQLERLLNKEIKNHKFVVYNLGIIGQNSFQVMDNLEKNILTYNPDYIIVLIGVNNRWNVSGRDCGISDDLQIILKNKILIVINDLRLIKLVRLTIANIRYRLFLHSVFHATKVNYDQSIDNKKIPLNEELQQEIFRIQQDVEKRNISESFIRAKEISEEYPDNGRIHNILGKIYFLQYNYEKVIEEYDKALALEPNNVSLLHSKAISYRESGNMEKALEIFGVMAKIDPKNKDLKNDFRHTFLNFKGRWALSDREQKIMDYWLRQDLSEIALISLRYKKRLILLTYPTQNWQDEIRKKDFKRF